MKKIKIAISLMSLFYFTGIGAQQVYTLDNCRSMAMEYNKDILISQEKVNVANNLKKAARTQYLPNISAKGAYLYNSRNLSLLNEDKLLPVGTKMQDGSFGFTQDLVNNQWTVVNGQPVPLDNNGQPFNPKTNPEKLEWKNYAYMSKEEFEVDIQNVFFGGIMATQPVYLGGKIRQLNKIASASKQIAEYQLNNEVSETIVKTDEAYWRVVSLSAKKQLAESYVKLLQQLNNDLEESIAAGVATKAEGLTVKVKLNEGEMTLLQVNNGLNLSKMLLAQLCGIAYNSEFQLADENIPSPTETELPNTEIDMQKSIENRSEIQSLEQAVNIAQANQRVQVSRFLPSIVATGGYTVSNPNMFNGISNTFDGMWNVGVVLNVPIFHWGEKINTLNASKSEKLIAQYKLEDAKEKIELQITQASYQSNEAYKRYIMAKSNMEKAKENLHYATIGFEAGVIPTSSVLEAQTAWLKANAEKIEADIDLKLCDVYLKKATGNLK